MARNTSKAKKATAPATTPDGPIMKTHELLLSSAVQGAVGIDAWSKFMGEVELVELVKELRDRTDRVVGGDMKPIEAMLFGQAMTLQTIFTSLSRKASSAEYLSQLQAHLGLALKAQAQCRATLEALAEIKNPRPVMFAKQANITRGNQQINNGIMPDGRKMCAGSHAEEDPSPQNGLLEEPCDEVAVGRHRHEHAGSDGSHVPHAG